MDSQIRRVNHWKGEGGKILREKRVDPLGRTARMLLVSTAAAVTATILGFCTSMSLFVGVWAFCVIRDGARQVSTFEN